MIIPPKTDKTKKTITTTEWCVIKPKYSDMYLFEKSKLYEDEIQLLKQTVALIKNPVAVLPDAWVLPVPAQLSTIAYEVHYLCEESDRVTSDFGFELLDTLMDPEHERSSPIQVIHAMLPKLIWKLLDDFSGDLRDFFEFYQHGEVIDELLEQLTTDPDLPETIDGVIDMLYKVLPVFRDDVISRDDMIRMAINHANGDY